MARYLLFDERRFWVRSYTRTVVHERDPDFARFARGSTGHVESYVRIWLAETRGRSAVPIAYLGGVRCAPRGLSARDRMRLERNLDRAAAQGSDAGQTPRQARGRYRRLFARQMRQFLDALPVSAGAASARSATAGAQGGL